MGKLIIELPESAPEAIFTPVTLENWESQLFIREEKITSFLQTRKFIKELLKDLNIE